MPAKLTSAAQRFSRCRQRLVFVRPQKTLGWRTIMAETRSTIFLTDGRAAQFHSNFSTITCARKARLSVGKSLALPIGDKTHIKC
jgi:hypothetical protein